MKQRWYLLIGLVGTLIAGVVVYLVTKSWYMVLFSPLWLWIAIVCGVTLMTLVWGCVAGPPALFRYLRRPSSERTMVIGGVFMIGGYLLTRRYDWLVGWDIAPSFVGFFIAYYAGKEAYKEEEIRREQDIETHRQQK